MSEKNSNQRYVCIRPFKKCDEVECKKIINDWIMSSARRAFISALFRETSFQLMVFLSAIMFIVLGVPLLYCAISVPLTVLSLYTAIWSTYYVNSLEVQQEVTLVPQQFQNSDKTGFWVAEYYGPMLDIGIKSKIQFLTPSQIEHFENELSTMKRRVVGMVGVQRSKDQACKAWLRRLAVSQDMRCQSIGTELLNKVCQFCYEKGYSALETSVTECQREGKHFLIKHQFELEQLYHKQVLSNTTVYSKYLFRKELMHTKSAMNA